MAKDTHEKIRRVLNAHEWPQTRRPELYLQGSYKNSTTIRADSDVDLVAELTSVFYSNRREAMTPAQLAYHESTTSDADYSWRDHHDHVLRALQDVYGDDADPKTNAIKVAAGAGRLAADVVVCAKYRHYIPNANLTVPNYHEGITFWANGRQVVNFPKQHYDNGAAKNSADRTRGQFKPVVRVFKNARRRLVQNGAMVKDLAPSYFIQCLLYNVPDSLFLGTYQESYAAVVTWLAKADLKTFVCQNGITALFGPSPTHWDVGSADAYVNRLIDLWNDWS